MDKNSFSELKKVLRRDDPPVDWVYSFYVSAETVRELVVAFNNGGLVSKYWKTAKEMVRAIRETFFIYILLFSPLSDS